MKRHLLLSLPLVLAACDGVSGDIAGNKVGNLGDTLYDAEVVDLGPLGSYTGLAIVMTGLDDACDAMSTSATSIGSTCTETCGQLLDYMDEHNAPDDLWTLYLFVTGDSSAMADTYSQSDTLMPPSFYASVEQDDTTLVQESAECVAACEEAQEVLPGSAWDATGGTVEITDYIEGERVEGNFELVFPDGEMKGDFEADLCDAFL